MLAAQGCRAMTEIDATGLLCPLPVLRARKALAGLAPGACLRLVADDPAARIDLPHFCTGAGHALVAEEDLGDGRRAYVIRRGGCQSPRPADTPEQRSSYNPFDR
jgi:tRNA 2-thiouridine synthesizing protein A